MSRHPGPCPPSPAHENRALLDDTRGVRHPDRMQDLGRWLIGVGVIVVLVGVAMTLAPRLPWLGRLPGDFVVRRDSFTLYFPLATSILVSVALTILFNLFGRR